MRLIIPYLAILLLLTSCFKEDEAVLPHEPGDVQTDMAAMTQTYSQMVFYDLGSASAVLETGKFAWDIAFESQPGGWRVLLNTTRFMKVAASGEYSFEEVTDTVGMSWRFDKSDGDPDSTGFGTWFSIQGDDTVSKEEIYILDLGFNNVGVALGLRKLKITAYNGASYSISFAKLDGSGYTEAVIPKEQGRPLVFYSLLNAGSATDVWPESASWDLWFTQYTTLLFTNEGDPYPYIVTGVLSNHRNGVQVAVDTTMDFGQIGIDFAQTLEFSSAADKIGYDWKWYDFDATSYAVLPGINYLVRTTEGYIYKLRFIGFYNQQGEKGYPTFEFQRL